jgi:Tfp pilus assembly protein PilO
MNIKNILKNLKEYIKDLFSDMQAIYLEKGPEPFKKPGLFAIGAIFISYLIYSSNTSTLKFNREELKKSKQIAEFFQEYKDLKTTFHTYSSMIPSIKDKDDFLNYILNKTASKYQITFTNIEGQKEIEIDNIYFISKQVQFSSDYNTIANFIKDIENSPLFVEISQVSLIKRQNDSSIGKIDVSLTVSSVFVEKL